MNRLFFSTLLVFCLTAVTYAQNAAENEKPAVSSLEEKLKAEPDDTALFNQYMIQNARKLAQLSTTDVDKAEKHIDAMRKLFESLEPQTDESKRLLSRAKSLLVSYERRIAIARTSIDEVKKKLEENPDDAQSISALSAKVLQEVGAIARSEPAKAEKQINEIKEFLAGVKAKAAEGSTKQAIDRTIQSFARLESTIASAKKLAALIGQESAALKVDGWVNGTPLTDADLKGKVVLLDFWAVWCGPCIRTFPHLREWQEKYADKGLVIIGLTRYHNYTWDASTNRAKRSPQKVSPEVEQKMLEQFAESHDLHHRFAIQQSGELSKFYGVTGIPHVVVIDREGKIRLMRVGSGEENARAVGEMIEKLIGDA